MAKTYSTKRSTKSKIAKTIKRPIKKAITKIKKKNDAFNSLYRFAIKKRRARRFNQYANVELQEKTVLFEAFMGRKYADSPKAIYEYMLNSDDYKDYKFIWFFRERVMDDYLYLEENDRTELILWGSLEYNKAYASAKYWVTNSRIPNAIQPREDQVYIQCWHGTPLKRLGFDIEVDASDAKNSADTVRMVYEQDAAKYTYMLSPSAYCSEKFTSAFNLKALGKEDIMVEKGYPRNDDIINHTAEDVARIKESLGIDSSKMVILYAPTWRDNQHTYGVGYTYEAPMDFMKMKERFGDDYVVLYRAHYFVANTLNLEAYGDFVIDACLYPEINDLYVIADILITDYSSVFFDYGILKRPMIFYMYDLKYYQDQLRGFYISLDEIPGPIIEEENALYDCIADVDKWTATEEYKQNMIAFNNKFTYLDDGHATERVVNTIFKKYT